MNSAFDRFLSELSAQSPAMEYVWSPQKAASAQWMIDRIAPRATGVDVGGTEWLCQELAKRQCNITCYDQATPASFRPFIQDDMRNIMSHFAEGSLDFITTRHTLEHSLTPMFQLWCYNRLLKDGGDLFVIVPSHIREWIWFQTHHNCLPRENWLMLFYRTGFKIIASDAGTWNPADSKFIEYRFHLRVETRELRMKWNPGWLPF